MYISGELLLQATNRVPRWRIWGQPLDMEASCEISRYSTWRISSPWSAVQRHQNVGVVGGWCHLLP